MPNIDTIGIDWLIEQVEEMVDEVVRLGVVEFNEQNRYLPANLTPRPGLIRYDIFPYLKELIECFDIESQIREVNLMKGVQTGYTTLLESVLFYYMLHIKTTPMMFLTADKELAQTRVELNFIPMINESGFSDHIKSNDIDNKRKTGKKEGQIEWVGGHLLYMGALNAVRMRQNSVPILLKDELDGWKRDVGKDGSSDSLTDDRASVYWNSRKILRGSTPLLRPSMIEEAYKRGDQRIYEVLCKSCSFPQQLRWHNVNNETGIVGGFQWDTEGDKLILESVRYCCLDCGHEHYEHDKTRLFSEDYGAKWKPTATPVEPGIRSYHLPGFYSPFGFTPWSKLVAGFIDAYDQETNQTKDIKKLQVHYNNTLGVGFDVPGSKIGFRSVSGHRRQAYRYGEIPNEYAAENSGSKILFVGCTVDVHPRFLAIGVFGFTRGCCSYLLDYWTWEKKEKDPDLDDLNSPLWSDLRELISNKMYKDASGNTYRLAQTYIDASFANKAVCDFCNEYHTGVFPVMGRDRPTKYQKITEFRTFKTQIGTEGYMLVVDHYKDRLAPILRRSWHEELGKQKEYHFNAPVDATDKQLEELTKERRREKTDTNGNVSYYWYKSGGARNELWDLLVYANAMVDITAYKICIEIFKLENVDWVRFWEYLEKEKLFFA